MQRPSHYEALGVAPGADGEALRRAYKQAALRTHPDKGGSAAGTGCPASEEYLRVQAAWGVLSDPAQRAAYDRGQALEASRAEVTVSEAVRLEEMGWVDAEGQACRSWPCRCGGAYLLPVEGGDDGAEGGGGGEGRAGAELLVPCTTCSLYIRALVPAPEAACGGPAAGRSA